MTIEELKCTNQAFISAADVAPILRVDPQCIRRQARVNPTSLGFPVTVLGSRCRIPRMAFLRFVEGVDIPNDYKEKS